jgi:menaquinone reductase, iron-sulfur cluster-binding subunit
MSARYGMVIDLDRCDGCGACMMACAVENNVPPAHYSMTDRKGLTWLRVYRLNNGAPFPANRTAFIPMLCQQCGIRTPCATVCPQEAVQSDPATGIVDQMPQRCLGCRYCMAACPYHARYFNWWDPVWPSGMEKALNPDVAPRMRGVVEKCNFCHGRYHAAMEKAAAEGKRDIVTVDYQPACVEACPTHAMIFGNLDDPESAVARASRRPNTFQLLPRLGTGPKIYFHSDRAWVRAIAEQPLVRIETTKGANRG